MNADPSRALEIAAKYYYWKPMTAFFRSIEMNLYHKSGISFQTPILDLGCGGGGISYILKEFNLLRGTPYGMDISSTELKKAQLAAEHHTLPQADANSLPFQNGSFSSIICNGVLCSIPEGVDQSLVEVKRVLNDGGIFVGTVPTNKFIDILIFPKLLNKVSKTLSLSYTEKLNNRLPHYNMYSPQEWNDKFENIGLRIMKSEMFFSPHAGFIWNILSMQIFRIFGLLKFIRNRRFIDFIGELLMRTIVKLYPNERKAGSDYGYVFIVAQKVTQ